MERNRGRDMVDAMDALGGSIELREKRGRVDALHLDFLSE